MKFAVSLVAVLLQCHFGGLVAKVVPETKTYATYSMTHPATSAGVYTTGSTNTYAGGSTTYYPQGALVTYQSACTIYYPTTTTVNTGNGGTYTYNAGSYVNYPANSQVSYQPGTTCFYRSTTSCTYGSYNGATSCAVRYPAQTPVTCSSSSQPIYYGPGQYNSGTTYYNYGGTGGTTYQNNNDGTQSSFTNIGYTQSSYPMYYAVNSNTGATSCVTQTGSNSYITYNTGSNGVSSSSTMYG